MTDNDRNMRTLVVSFMVALMVMVPLRFIEATKTTLEEANRVLGESTYIQPVRRVVQEKPVVVTNSELEAPYNKIEMSSDSELIESEVKSVPEVKNPCLTAGTASRMINTLVKSSGDVSEMTEAESALLFEKIDKIEKRICTE